MRRRSAVSKATSRCGRLDSEGMGRQGNHRGDRKRGDEDNTLGIVNGDGHNGVIDAVDEGWHAAK